MLGLSHREPGPRRSQPVERLVGRQYMPVRHGCAVERVGECCEAERDEDLDLGADLLGAPFDPVHDEDVARECARRDALDERSAGEPALEDRLELHRSLEPADVESCSPANDGVHRRHPGGCCAFSLSGVRAGGREVHQRVRSDVPSRSARQRVVRATVATGQETLLITPPLAHEADAIPAQARPKATEMPRDSVTRSADAEGRCRRRAARTGPRRCGLTQRSTRPRASRGLGRGSGQSVSQVRPMRPYL